MHQATDKTCAHTHTRTRARTHTHLHAHLHSHVLHVFMTFISFYAFHIIHRPACVRALTCARAGVHVRGRAGGRVWVRER